MPASTYHFLSDGRGEGVVVNRSGEPLGFFSVAPTAQATYVATLSTTVPVSTSGANGYAFATSAQAIALTAAVNSIIGALIAKGLMASS